MHRLTLFILGILITFSLIGVQALFSFTMNSMEGGHGTMASSDCVNICLSNAINEVTSVSTMSIVLFAIPIFLIFFVWTYTLAPLRIHPIITGPPDPRLKRLVVRRE